MENSPVYYQSSLIVGVCYGGKAVVGSVGNMLASSVTRLPVLWSWMVICVNQSGLVVAEIEVLSAQGSRSRVEQRPVF